MDILIPHLGTRKWNNQQSDKKEKNTTQGYQADMICHGVSTYHYHVPAGPPLPVNKSEKPFECEQSNGTRSGNNKADRITHTQTILPYEQRKKEMQIHLKLTTNKVNQNSSQSKRIEY